MFDKYTEDAKIFKALCDPKRLAILELLQSGEKCACKLMEELDIAQSALSYHMKILCESQIVTSRQDGKWTHYRISQTGCERAIEKFNKITLTKEDEKSCCNCNESH